MTARVRGSTGVLLSTSSMIARSRSIVTLPRPVPSGASGGGAIGEILRDSDVHICVPAERTARIQETHLLIIHCLSDGIDCLLMGVEE